MISRASRCLRLFSLDTHFTLLSEKLRTSITVEDLYQITDAFLSDATVVNADPRRVLKYQDSILEVQARFGQHSKQLISGIVKPLLTRVGILSDLGLADGLSLLKLYLQLKEIVEVKPVKQLIQTVTKLTRDLQNPLDANSILDLYTIQRQTKVLSYELISELESAMLFDPKLNLFSGPGSDSILATYAELNLSFRNVWPILKKTLKTEFPQYTGEKGIGVLKVLVMTDTYDLELWRDVLLPWMQGLKVHHLGKESMIQLGLVVTALDLLAPKDVKSLDFFQSEAFNAIKTQALGTYRTRIELSEYPLFDFFPASPSEMQLGKQISSYVDNLTKVIYPNALTEDIAKALKMLNVQFTVNYVTPQPYSLYAEIFVPPNLVVKPMSHTDYIYDSFQPTGSTKLRLRLLDSLHLHIAEVNYSDWAKVPRISRKGQIARLIKLAQAKTNRI